MVYGSARIVHPSLIRAFLTALWMTSFCGIATRLIFLHYTLRRTCWGNGEMERESRRQTLYWGGESGSGTHNPKVVSSSLTPALARSLDSIRSSDLLFCLLHSALSLLVESYDCKTVKPNIEYF